MSAEHLLGISTSSGVASLAIVKKVSADSQGARFFNGLHFTVLFECEIADYKAQSAELLPRLNAALQSLHLNASDFIAIGVDIGPGGFTSLRTSCGVAQGLCTAWELPAVVVSSFEAMWANWVLQGGDAQQPVNCVIDARLNELYCAQLNFISNGMQFIKPPHLLPVPEFSTIEPGVLLCDQGAANLAVQAGIEGGIVQPASAVGVAAWGLSAALRGLLHSALDCQPLYVREKVAQTTSERLATRHGTL